MATCITRSWAHLRSTWHRPSRLTSTAAAIAGKYSSPTDLLKSFGRSSETKLKVDSWEQLWSTKSLKLKAAGIGVRDRRYILWALERVKQGFDPSDFSHERKPKKKTRGWGPRKQNGKIIKSRRRRMPH